MTPAEQAQIEAAQKDKCEFVHLYDAHFDAIYRFLLSRVADRQLAEDLTSDTFMIALERIDKYRERVKTEMFTTAGVTWLTTGASVGSTR